MDIKLLDMSQQGDPTFIANQKINHNLLQINKDVKLLPESPSDASIKNLPFLKYLHVVNEIIHHNSMLIGFSYPLLEINTESPPEIVKKVYQPISEYIQTLTA